MSPSTRRSVLDCYVVNYRIYGLHSEVSLHRCLVYIVLEVVCALSKMLESPIQSLRDSTNILLVSSKPRQSDFEMAVFSASKTDRDPHLAENNASDVAKGTIDKHCDLYAMLSPFFFYLTSPAGCYVVPSLVY